MNDNNITIADGAIAELKQMIAKRRSTIAALTEDKRKLVEALQAIASTTVELGKSQSAWIAWRECTTIANDAIKAAK